MSIVFTVQNFQGIEYCQIVLDRYITIFGDTNSGKSCLIRALDALLNNTWEKSYMRRGAKECELRLEIPPSESHTVSYVLRKKSKKANYYEIGHVDGTKTVVKKAGGHAPPEALVEMGFAPVVTDRDDRWNMNFQFQLDPLFMVKSREPELTAFLNKMFQIDKYEGALRAIQRDLVKQDQGFKAAQAKVPVLKETIEELSVEVEDKEKTRDALKGAIQRTEQLQASLEQIEGGLESFVKVGVLKESLEVLSENMGTLDLLLPKVSLMASFSEKLVYLAQKRNQWDALGWDCSLYSGQEGRTQVILDRVSVLVPEVGKLEQIGQCHFTLQRLEDSLLPLRGDLGAMNSMKAPLRVITKTVETLVESERFLRGNCDLGSQISSISGKEAGVCSVKSEFGVWKSLTFAGTECPTCGQIMGNDYDSE